MFAVRYSPTNLRFFRFFRENYQIFRKKMEVYRTLRGIFRIDFEAILPDFCIKARGLGELLFLFHFLPSRMFFRPVPTNRQSGTEARY